MIKKISYLIVGFVVVSTCIFLAVSLYVDSGSTGLEDNQSFVYATTTIDVNGSIFVVDIADTRDKLKQGLSDRQSLSKEEGMFFVFDVLYTHGIWMKDMHFNIDVLWLDEDGAIVYIIEHMQPSSYPGTSYVSPLPARYVVELPSGTVQKNNVKLGDILAIPVREESNTGSFP